MMPERSNHLTFNHNFRRNTVAALSALLIALFAAGIVEAEWYKDYEAGLELMKKGRYTEAVPKLQAAIADKNAEGIHIKFYGMKFDDYLPHYYLGKAYFFLKNYESALRELEISSSQGAIQREKNLFQNLTELKTLSIAQLRTTQTPTPPVIAQKKPEPAPPKQEPAQPQPQPQPDPPSPQKQQPSAPAKQPEKKIAVKETPKEVKPAATVTKTETPKAPPVPVPTVEEQNLERAKSMAKNGARKYFQGDFDSAISAFSAALKLAPQDASAQFLLGCSYAAKYLLSGSSDETSLEKAASAFERVQKINPNLPLTKSNLISPAVREIYQKTSGA
jgi:tetratricopeptide (TPR) repeat protein